MKREQVRASEDHKKNFLETFELRSDLVGDPYWEAAYTHAANFKLYPDEMMAVGPALVRKNQPQHAKSVVHADDLRPMLTVNAYLKDQPGGVHDKFPINSWDGDIPEVVDCIRNLLNNPDSGIARVEIVIDPSHPNFTVGLNPRRS